MVFRWVRACKKIFSILTAPSTQITDLRQRHQARLLASLALLSLPFAAISFAYRLLITYDLEQLRQNIFPTLSVILTMSFGYILSRSRYFRVGTYFVFFSGVAIITTQTLADYPDVDVEVLDFFIPVLLVSTALHSLRINFVFIIFILLFMPVLSIAFPALTAEILAEPLTFIIVTMVFIVTVTYHRDQIEDERQGIILDREARLSLLIERVPGFVWITDTDLNLTSLSGSTLNMFINELDEQAKMRMRQLFEQEVMKDETLLARQREALSGSNVSGQVTWNERVFECHMQTLLDRSGHTLGCIGVGIDITESLQQEQQAMQIAVEQERAQLLTSFIQNASHDLKTPLATINTSLYLLQKSKDSQEQQERHIAVLEKQAARLNKLVDNLILMAQLDSQEEFVFQTTNINMLIRDAFERHETQASQKALTIEYNLDESLPAISIDQVALYNALLQVIANAVHYTPEKGEITLRTRRAGNSIEIEIEDSGQGIPEEAQAAIFGRFYRVDPARSIETGGNGLGLAIAKKVVDAHQGQISVSSQPNKGSVFTISLPVRMPDEQAITL